MADVKQLETTLDDMFNKKAPQLPKNGKVAIVGWVPWIALIVGIFSLLTALGLWHWTHPASTLSYYAQQLCATYNAGSGSCPALTTSHLTFWTWLAIISLILQATFYLLAFPGLRERKKVGWTYLYYGTLTNVVYAVVSLFADYDPAGHFIGALIGSAIGFYILFQIRSSYLGVGEPVIVQEITEPIKTVTPTIKVPKVKAKTKTPLKKKSVVKKKKS